MIRGTTPTHIFKMPLDASLIKEVKVVYSQGGVPILEKRTANCEIESGKIVIRLSQEDTFKFKCGSHVYMQVRVLTNGGECINSRLLMATVDECLDSEVLV